jgi:hypothetical protein
LTQYISVWLNWFAELKAKVPAGSLKPEPLSLEP